MTGTLSTAHSSEQGPKNTLGHKIMLRLTMSKNDCKAPRPLPSPDNPGHKIAGRSGQLWKEARRRESETGWWGSLNSGGWPCLLGAPSPAGRQAQKQSPRLRVMGGKPEVSRRYGRQPASGTRKDFTEE